MLTNELLAKFADETKIPFSENEMLSSHTTFRIGGPAEIFSNPQNVEQAAAAVRFCKENGINTAIETTGFASVDVIKRFLPYLDTVLMDIKHINPIKHKEFTTQSNERILENAKFIASQASKLIIRVPVIPTFNDTVDEISQIAEFASSLPNVDEIHLLPYHSLGRDKYVGLGREYGMGDLKSPTNELMRVLTQTAERFGLKAQIGG